MKTVSVSHITAVFSRRRLIVIVFAPNVTQGLKIQREKQSLQCLIAASSVCVCEREREIHVINTRRIQDLTELMYPDPDFSIQEKEQAGWKAAL